MPLRNWPVQVQMDKPPQNTVSAKRAKAERLSSRRCKITQLMRIRPSDPQRTHFDDIRGSISVSPTGVYFQTTETGYELGLRLFLIIPYSQHPASRNADYLDDLVRNDA